MTCENIGFDNYSRTIDIILESHIDSRFTGVERKRELIKQHLIDRVSAFVLAKIMTAESTLCRFTAVVDYTVLAISNKNPQILRNAALHLIELAVTLVVLPILGCIGVILPELALTGAELAEIELAPKLKQLLSPVHESTIHKDGKFVGTYLDITSYMRSIISCSAKILESPLDSTISINEQFGLISAIFTTRVQLLRSIFGT